MEWVIVVAIIVVAVVWAVVDAMWKVMSARVASLVENQVWLAQKSGELEARIVLAEGRLGEMEGGATVDTTEPQFVDAFVGWQESQVRCGTFPRAEGEIVFVEHEPDVNPDERVRGVIERAKKGEPVIW